MPFIMRGPGVPAGRTIRGQVSNIDFAPTLLDFAKARSRAGRRMDGVSLRRTIAARGGGPSGRSQIEALAPLFEGNIPVNAWDRPYKGVRTDRYTYVVYTETGEEELYDRRKDPAQLRNVAADPAYARREGQARRRSCAGSTAARGAPATSGREGAALSLAAAAIAAGAAWRTRLCAAAPASTTRATARSSSSRARRPAPGPSSGTRSS